MFRSDVVLKGLEPISDDYRRNSLVFSDKGSAPQPRVGIRDVLPLFSGDASLEGLEPISDECRRQNLVMFVDYDSFMGTPDGGWSNNGIREFSKKPVGEKTLYLSSGPIAYAIVRS